MIDLTEPRHRYSAAGDSRENPVPCGMCRRNTWNICGTCDQHCACADTGRAANAADMDPAAAMLKAVDDTLDVFEHMSLPVLLEDATPEQGQDVRATVGMGRLLADVVREHPTSPSGWQMLSSTLGTLREKARVLGGVAVAALITVGLVVSPTSTPGAAASTNPNPTTTVTTTTTTTTVTRTVTTTTPPVPVVRRKSVVSGYVSAAGYSRTPGYGLVNIAVQTRHLAGKAYQPSAYSPVAVQRLIGGKWKTVITVTTGRDGMVFKQIIAPSGIQRYRFVRPEGATVTAAVSGVYTVGVPSTPGC